MAETQNQSNVPHPAPVQFNTPFEFRVEVIQGISAPVAYRPTVDVVFLKSILQNEEYKLPPNIKDFQPKLILDCGGNVGFAAVYFANKYPNAQIYSVEPEQENFNLLKFNTAFYNNVHPLKSALWDKETFIRVETKGHRPGDFMTFETDEKDVTMFKSVTVSKLLANSGFDEIDLLKIDIEGAEKEVFSAPDVDEWLPKVKVLTIELHDRMKRGCSYAFFKAISKYHWFHAFRGENLIFVRENGCS